MELIGRPLFYSYYNGDLDQMVIHHQQRLEKRVLEISDGRFDAHSVADLVDMIIDEHWIEPIVIDYDSEEKYLFENPITLAGPPATKTHGFELSITYRFSGDSELWDWGANDKNADLPKAVTDRHWLKLAVKSNRIEEIPPQVLRIELEKIESWLKKQEVVINKFNRALPAFARRLVRHRKQQRDQARRLLKRL